MELSDKLYIPITEDDFFIAIETVIYYVNLLTDIFAEFSDREENIMVEILTGQMTTEQEETEKKINKMEVALENLILEFCIRFDIIHPKDLPEEKKRKKQLGFENFDDWFERMWNKIAEEEYNGIVCSVCPFSRGLEEFKQFRRKRINPDCIINRCAVLDQDVEMQEPYYLCEHIKKGIWTADDLCREMTQQYGEEAWLFFMQKIVNLKSEGRRELIVSN